MFAKSNWGNLIERGECKMNVLDFFSAVSKGDLEKVKEFYANGGKVDLNHNLTYACGATWLLPLPLVTAFQKGFDDIAKFLIKKGADLDAYCKKYNITPREVKSQTPILNNNEKEFE